jgi:hypothetical protein
MSCDTSARRCFRPLYLFSRSVAGGMVQLCSVWNAGRRDKQVREFSRVPEPAFHLCAVSLRFYTPAMKNMARGDFKIRSLFIKQHSHQSNKQQTTRDK